MRAMNQWQRRASRAEELAGRYPFASEILQFYEEIARFQGRHYFEIEGSRSVEGAAEDVNPFERGIDREVGKNFGTFLSVVREKGPGKLQDAARVLLAQDSDSHFKLLISFWDGDGEGGQSVNEFFARAFLQPYAVLIRERAKLRWKGSTAYLCPFCKKKPGVGLLRPLGEGAQRTLMCSFCLGEWEFRRILCPGCGEGDPAKLPVYSAEELEHVRVDACDSCKSYIKTVDLTKSALGEPIVDEIAAVPLDLWAGKQGYVKLQANILQL